MTVGMLEGPDLIIVLVIVMVMFGAKKLPELARGLGHAKREFEDAIKPDTTTTTSPAADAKAIPATAAVEPSPTVTVSRAEYEQLQALRRSIHDDQKDDPPVA